MLLKLYPKNNNPADLQRVVDLLRDGGLLIYPTDTMYAIGCHGLKERAIERICRLKGIDPRRNNLSIICYDLAAISEYAKMDNAAFKLMKRNLPGPFTFILNGTTRLPKIFRNRREVGIRMQPARSGYPHAGLPYHTRNCPLAGRPHHDHHPTP